MFNKWSILRDPALKKYLTRKEIETLETARGRFVKTGKISQSDSDNCNSLYREYMRLSRCERLDKERPGPIQNVPEENAPCKVPQTNTNGKGPYVFHIPLDIR